MNRLRPEHPFFDGPSWRDAVRAATGWSAPREVRVKTFHPARPELIPDYLASMSWVAAMPDPERAKLLAAAAELVRGGETPPRLGLEVVVGLAIRE
jgi:hypothetical protein